MKMTPINAEQALEKALEVIRKSGWSYAIASEVFKKTVTG
jgi:hypothetical protein